MPEGIRSREAMKTRVEAAKPLDIFGVNEKVPLKKRTPEEVTALKERIGFLAKVFSRNYNMEVYPSPEGGWACAVDEKIIPVLDQYMRGEIASLDSIDQKQLQPTQIFYDVKDVEGGWSEDEILGVMRHEIGHAKNTDYKLLFEGQKFARDEGYMPSSWASAWNACEDPWVNNKEIGDSEVVREKMTALYRRWMPETIEKITTQPVSHQLGLNIIHYWLTGESIPTIKDQEVLKAFEGIRSAVDDYFSAATAQETHQIFKTRIWDTFKRFQQKAADDEVMKEMMRRMSKDNLGDGNEKSGKEEQGKPGEGKPGESKKGMLDILKEKLGLKPSKSAQPQQGGGEGQEAGQPAPGSKEIQEAVSKEMQRQKKELQQKNEQLAKQGHSTGDIPDDIDLEAVPEELKKEINKTIQELDQKSKEALAKKAKELLDKKQAEAANKRVPKTLKMKKDKATGEYVPTMEKPPKGKDAEKVKQEVDAFNKEQEAKAEQAAEAEAKKDRDKQAKEKAKQKEEDEKQAMTKEGFDPATQRELYKKFKQLESAMESQINSFMRVMERYLPKKEETDYSGEATYMGRKLSKKDVIKRAPVSDYRVMLRRQIRESEETRLFIALLIDNSGSMQGEKMNESLKTAIFFARVLKRFGIPFAITFFGDRPVPIMKFGDEYDDPTKHIKPNILSKGDASGGGTDMSTPIIDTVKNMTEAKRKYVGCHGGVFVISDSGANAGPLVGDQLSAYIKEQQKTFSMLNLLLSNSAGDLAEAERLFGKSNVVQAGDFSKLPQEAFKVLRITLERVLKTQRSIQ